LSTPALGLWCKVQEIGIPLISICTLVNFKANFATIEGPKIPIFHNGKDYGTPNADHKFIDDEHQGIGLVIPKAS
jgi:hypothetical protein